MSPIPWPVTAIRFPVIWIAAVLGGSVAFRVAPNAAEAAGERVSYTRHVQPILAKHCYACHGPDEAASGLILSDRDSAVGASDSGLTAIIPGDPDASELISRISTDDEFDRMPPEGDPVPPASIDVLRRWIDQGAAWEQHWAFQPRGEVEPPAVDPPAVDPPAVDPPAVDPPAVDAPEWSEHPIDRFVFDSLDQAGLRPNAPADRRTLIRRATYDLTGLPPDPGRVEAFVRDPAPDAYQRLIDELLESPHYGERWGRHWLDLVRYAETNSFERDEAKPNAWKYRDYVIRSFNDDKPYDQFVREQIAGDELDEVTPETLAATGYYRLGIWDDEPADPLQARYDELDDLVATTGQVFLGLTINCARCHDHKIDPIPQTDYYQLLAFFADVTTYGTRGDKTGNNQIDVSPDRVKRKYDRNDAARRKLQRQIRTIEQEGIAKMPAEDQRATEGPRRERQQVLDEKLQDHLDPTRWQTYRDLRKRLDAADAARKALPPRESVLGLARSISDPEPTRVLFRGNPHAPGDEVEPGFPTLFADPPPNLPESDRTPEARDPERSGGQSESGGQSDPGKKRGSLGRRRVLADWIASPDNRLAARVMANRIWQYHFGRGIVESSNNFGRLGTPPTHPELLDWLAQRFIADGWRLKSMHRRIMLSQTYRMSSRRRPEPAEIDPANERLWRFEPRRLSAEEVRDSILAVSGSLNRETYGPSVYPELSPEVLAGQSRPGSGWGDSPPEDQNRRSVYIHVKRSLLTPLLSAFDFPEPDRSCEARFATLQPGQALSLLNGDFVHDQAERLADQVLAELGDPSEATQSAERPAPPESSDSASATRARSENEAIVRHVIRRVFARPASDAEIADGDQLIRDLQSEHRLGRRPAVKLYCLSVLNWNEFVFLD